MSRPIIPSSFKTLSPDKQFAFLKHKREDLFSSVNKLYESSKAVQDVKGDSIKPYLDRLTSFENKFEELKEYIDLFNVLTEDPELVLENSQVSIAFYEVLDSTKSNYLRQCSVKSHESHSVNQFSQSELPRIVLPIFSGDIEGWSEFYSLFESLVDKDQQLSETKKFQYLKTSLKGDALSVISQLDFIPENYILAKESLKKRYENKRRLASLYINKILNFKLSGRSDYQRLLTTLENSWNGLEKLNIPDLKDYLKLFLSLEKLDFGTRKAFESQHSPNSFPTYEDLIKHLTEKVKVDELLSSRALSESGTSNSKESVKKSKGYVERMPNKVLSICSSKESHGEGDTNNAKLKGNNLPGASSSSEVSSDERTQKQNSNVSVHDSGTTKKISCWNCGGPHLYSQCKQTRKRFCYRCGAKGVSTNTCSHCNQGNSQGTKS